MNYPSPCDKCTKKTCRELVCPEYIMFINSWWKHFNGVYVKLCTPVKLDGSKFCYENPGVYQHWIQNGPCPGCQANHKCQTPCATYWKWWNDRQEWHKRRFSRADKYIR